MNSIGQIFKLTDFGESHGKAMGGIIDGCPSGLIIDKEFIDREMKRRAPSHHSYSTLRREHDNIEFLSGITDGKSTGAPIGFLIENEDVIYDTENINLIKPSHASFTYREKYGASDNRYCDRASARQTVCRVVGGAIAKLALARYNIIITAETVTLGTPQKDNDTFGAKIKCTIFNLPAGLGEPIYDKFHARLAYAMLSINACRGFEIGAGFESAQMTGRTYNDLQNSDFSFKTNHDGGVQAGITNGQPVVFQLAFKPIPTFNEDMQTIDFKGNERIYHPHSKNDLSVVPRVLPIVEAMAAMISLDFLLLNNCRILL